MTINASNHTMRVGDGGILEHIPSTPFAEPNTVSIFRTDGGSGSVLVSTGIPLPQGALQVGEGEKVALDIASVREPITVHETGGRHKDGSVKSVVVQFTKTLGPSDNLSGEIYLTDTPLAEPATYSAQTYTELSSLPAAMCVPNNADYLALTDIAYAVLPTSQNPVTQLWTDYEAQYTSSEASHYSAEEPLADYWIYNYYDRATTYFGMWARTGNATLLQRGLDLAVEYRDDYVEDAAYLVPPREHLIDGLAVHYMLTGDEASRTAVGEMAQNIYEIWGPPNLSAAELSDYFEGRIEARTFKDQIVAYLINAPTGGHNYATNIAACLSALKTRHAVDPLFRYESLAGTGAYTGEEQAYNFMTMMVLESLITYNDYYQTDASIPTMVKATCDALDASFYDAPTGLYHYSTGDSLQPGTGLTSTGGSLGTDLNGMFALPWAWYYKQSQTASYKTRAETTLQSMLDNTFFTGYKQFNQSYMTSYRVTEAIQ